MEPTHAPKKVTGLVVSSVVRNLCITMDRNRETSFLKTDWLTAMYGYISIEVGTVACKIARAKLASMLSIATETWLNE